MASTKGLVVVCNLLLHHQAEIDAVDSAKKTPLYYALQNKHHEVIKLLLRKQACPWSDSFCNYKVF
jgi:ankyrin repeat protein